MTLKINITKKQDGAYVAALSGSIDSDTYTDLELKLKPFFNTSTKVLILNMEGVSYIASLGIRVILSAKRAVEKGGGVFMMTGLQPQIKKVFDIVHLLPAMNVFADIEEADRYFGTIQRREMEKQKKPTVDG